jgi:serine phosphatase RsbU (regulator of sigma subunit)/pSer/pThr/pTyr-binding forkhead associated (FHA) protein
VAILQVVKGNRPGQILEISGDRVILGRHPSCEIVLDNAAVSRQHAQILLRQGSFFLEDLSSRNRTYLNGTPIEGRTLLSDADEVKICDVVLRFFRSDASRGIGPDGQVLPPATREERASEVPGIDAPSSSGTGVEPLADDDSASSSIITTLNAKSAPAMRLGVKPEAKLRAILEISNALARTLNLDDVLQSLLEGLFKVFPYADAGFIHLREHDQRKSVVKAAHSRPGVQSGSVRISNTIIQKAMDSGEAILSADALEDSRFDSSESLDGLSIRSMMCVPLMSKDGAPLGVIQLDTRNLGQQFTQSDLDVMVSVASQASLAIDNARLHEDLLRRSDIERELRFATQVQLGFLPEHRPSLEGYEFFDYYEPAQRVGGDYFDYIALPEGRVAIGLADVAGKGIPAALLMARLNSSVRLHLMTQPSAGKVLSALNAEIYAQGMGHRFVTFVLLLLDPRTHELTIANAGHLPPIVRTGSAQVRSLDRKSSGMPLGITPAQDYAELKLPIEPDMTVTVYTDGITEAMNPETELFGRERLERFITASPSAPAELVKGIVSEVDRFCGSRPQRDDMCLVCVRRLPASVPGTLCPADLKTTTFDIPA